jgi:hypothetical protein
MALPGHFVRWNHDERNVCSVLTTIFADED